MELAQLAGDAVVVGVECGTEMREGRGHVRAGPALDLTRVGPQHRKA